MLPHAFGQPSNFHSFSVSPYTPCVDRLTLRVDDSVALRQIAESDAEELMALIDRNRSCLREWLPWIDSTTDIQQVVRFIGRSTAQAEDDNGFTFGIVCDGVLAGVLGQHHV